ncbi:MAG: gamma-glutamyltransferase, partial [Gammaproteobacteria bacterium]|nr:gamma-glutamyltransferase [Gammaproteobacteria bacterium]
MSILGAIACGHPQTAAAAEEILLDGGNAFDAIIAAQLMACVTEPVLASLGGGGFLLAQAQGTAPRIYDFFPQTPLRRAADQELYPIEANFGTATQTFHIGLGSAAVPGSVAGIFAVHEALATLPLARLVEPAVNAARNGIIINDFQG